MTINEIVKVVLKRLKQITHNIKSTRRSQNQNGFTKRVSRECRQYLGVWTKTAGVIKTTKHDLRSSYASLLPFLIGDTARGTRTFSTNILNELEGSRLIKALKLELSLRHYLISLANP